jgi:plastocyanin
MKKSSIIGIIIAIILIVGVAVAAMSYGNNTKKTTTSSSTTAATSTNAVTIQSYAFSPTAITVKVGTKVTWTNKDSVAHTVISDDGSADTFKSGDINQDASYSYTFSKAGTFTYHCAFHPDMTGKVIVTQ